METEGQTETERKTDKQTTLRTKLGKLLRAEMRNQTFSIAFSIRDAGNARKDDIVQCRAFLSDTVVIDLFACMRKGLGRFERNASQETCNKLSVKNGDFALVQYDEMIQQYVLPSISRLEYFHQCTTL